MNLDENKISIEPEKSPYYGIGGFILEVLKIVFLAFLIFAPIRFLVFQPFFVQGSSMEPNFENSEYLFIREFGYKPIVIGTDENRLVDIRPFSKIERGWPIVFRYPKNRTQYFIKRVIGLPGEKVQIKDGQVIVFNDQNPNGFVLDESGYLSKTVKTAGDLVLNLSKDEYFVMGDNRMFSSDSRSWGAVSEDDIIGKVIFRAWPMDRVNTF